jgi:transposase
VKDVSKKQLLEMLKQRDQRIEELQNENALLRQKVDLLIRKVFGSSSEKLDPSQLDLFLLTTENTPGKSEASSALEEADPQPSRRHGPRNQERLPEDLPVVEQVIDPEEVTAQPEHWRCIGSEVSEQLDYEPARFLRRRLVRRKYVSRLNPLDAPVIAKLPSMLQERCTVAPGLLAQVIVSKYVDHLPLYRQEQIYWTRHRVWLPRQNLARWMGMVADWLKPIYQCIRTGVMAGGYVSQAMAKPRPATFGRPRVQAAMPFTSGKPVVRRRAWTRCCQSILRARCSAMVMPRTPALLATKSTSNWRRVGRTPEGSFTRRVIKTHASPTGCYARSVIFIASSENFETTGVDPNCGQPSALIRLDRFTNDFTTR